MANRFDSFVGRLLRDTLAAKRGVLQQAATWTWSDTFTAFYHAITWSEPWIVGILATHVLLAALVITLRRHSTLQIVMLGCICAFTFTVQKCNGLLGKHWKELGFTQNYFDHRGIFMSIFISFPLLCIALFQVLYSVFMSGKLLILVKRTELQRKRAADAKANAVAAGGDTRATAAAVPAGETKKSQ